MDDLQPQDLGQAPDPSGAGAPGPGAPASGAPPSAAPAPSTSAPDAAAAGAVPWGAGSIFASGTEPVPAPAPDALSDADPHPARAGRAGTQKKGKGGTRRGRKPAIVRAKDPVTRESLAFALENTDLGDGTDIDSTDTAFGAGEHAVSGSSAGDGTTEAAAPALGWLQGLWDAGVVESGQYAAKLREVAIFAPHSDDMDLRDEAEYLVAQALRTTINRRSCTTSRDGTEDTGQRRHLRAVRGRCPAPQGPKLRVLRLELRLSRASGLSSCRPRSQWTHVGL